MLPSADEISQETPPHPVVRVPSWIPAHLADLKRQILNHMRTKIIAEPSRKKGSVHTNRSAPASAQNQS
jgi:hypothetical protein